MRASVFLITLALVSACLGRKDKESVSARLAVPRAAVAPTAADVLDTAPNNTPSSIPGLAKLNCDSIITAALRDKFFAGQTLRDVPRMSASEIECMIEGWIAGSFFKVDCAEGTEAAIKAEGNAMRHLGWKPLAGVGDGGVISRTHEWITLEAYDDNSPCIVEVHVPKKRDAIALAKQILAALPLAEAAAGARR